MAEQIDPIQEQIVGSIIQRNKELSNALKSAQGIITEVAKVIEEKDDAHAHFQIANATKHVLDILDALKKASEHNLEAHNKKKEMADQKEKQ